MRKFVSFLERKMDKDFYKLCQQKNDCLQAQYETERKYIYNKYNQEFTV